MRKKTGGGKQSSCGSLKRGNPRNPLLPPPLSDSVPAAEEQTYPRQFGAWQKRAQIVSLDEEDEESSSEVNGLFKHRKLSDSKTFTILNTSERCLSKRDYRL